MEDVYEIKGNHFPKKENKLPRLQRRKAERLQQKLDTIKARQLERLRKTPEYQYAKKAIAEFYEKKNANQPGLPQPGPAGGQSGC